MLPGGVVLISLGADLQADRIEVEIVGWGRDEESAGARNEALDARCYAYAALQSLIASRFRLNIQAQQIEALMAAKAGSDETPRQPAPSVSRDREPWIEQRDWFNRRSDY